MGSGKMPRRQDFHHRRASVLRASALRGEHSCSESVLLFKTYCLVLCVSPHPGCHRIIQFCGLLISRGLVVDTVAPVCCLGSENELLQLFVLCALLEITDQQLRSGQ